MKRVFAFFFCALLAGQVWAQSFQSGSLWYRIDDQEARTVTVINDESYYYLTQVVIPETVSYNGIDYSVTSISPNAFYGYTKIHSVDIPKTITNIGDDAFAGCSNVAILSYNTHAVYDAIWQVEEDFLGGLFIGQINRPMLSCMVSLETVNIGDAVTIIPDGCFSGEDKPLTTVNIGNSVTTIGNDAFSHSDDLRNVIIPNSVTSIGNNAFGNCLSLKYLDIPESVTSIGTDAFLGIDVVSYSGTAEGCPWGAESIAEGDFVYYDCEKKTLKSYIGKGGHVVIPDNVTSIGENAFPSYDIYYSLIEIPETVTSIEPDAFSNVGPIFYSGSAAGSPWGASGIEYYKDGDFLFYDEQLTQIKSYIGNGGEVVIPSTVTSIGIEAFYGCSGLTSVTIPNSVTSIGDEAFRGCFNLTSITIPNSVTGIGYNAFGDCQNVKTLTFDTDAVFITPEKWNAFNWGGLEYSFEDMMMMDKEQLDFLLSILELEGVCTLLFSDMSSLETINIGENVSFIGPRLFHNNNSIKTVNIGSTVKLIGTEAFSGCTGLASISIPESVIGIGENAFSGVNTLMVGSINS